MDSQALHYILQDEIERSPFPSFISNMKNSIWDNDNRNLSYASNIHDTPYLCTPMETYQPDQASVYTTLTPSSTNMSPLYMNSPTPPNEQFLEPPPSYTYPAIKTEPVRFYDDGIGSSASSNHSSSPHNIENRSSPFQRGSDRGSIADSDFADGDRVSPSMRRLESLQCVGCGVFQYDNQWMLDNSGNLVCKKCAPQTPSSDSSGPNNNNNNNRRKKSTGATKRANIVCVNCGTGTTSLWRRNGKGDFVCNACGLYEKLHKRQRPPNMKKDTIQRRKRKARSTDSKKRTETPKSPARAYPTPTLPALMYQTIDDANCYQPHGHSLISLPSMNNSRNVLFNYVSDSQNQLLQPSGLGYSNDAKLFPHLPPTS